MIGKILYNTVAQTVSRLVVVVLSLATTSFLTRKLGSQGWGEYVFLTSFVLLLGSLADWGTPLIVVREVAAAGKNQTRRLLAAAFGLRLFLTTTVFLLGIALVVVLPWFKDARFLGILAMLMLPLFYLSGNLKIIFHWQLRMDKQGVLETVNSLFFLVGCLLFASKFGVRGVILAWLLAKTFSIFLGKASTPFSILPLQRVDLAKILTFWKESLPLGAFLLLFTAYDRGVDVLFLKHFWGENQVGFYGLSYKIYSNLVLPAYFFANSIFPFFAKQKKGSLFWLTAAVAFFGGVITGLSSFLLAPFAILLLGGEAFTPSILLLKILSLALPLAFFNHIGGFILIARQNQNTMLKIGGAAFLVNLLFNLFFIPSWGGVAASLVTLATEATVSLGILIALVNLKF